MSENRREMETGIHLDLRKGGTYGDYLHLDELLAAQRPVTDVHDEMLFIIQHHTSELWIKLLLHELDCAVGLVRADRLGESFKIFARVAHIQRMLFEQWAVLETMTPSEYLQFRDALGKASGFQSYQYRALEFVLGNKDANTLKPHQHDARIHAELSARLQAPSLYDEFLGWLARQGHAIPADRVARDFTQPYTPSTAVLEVFRVIYGNPDEHYAAYDMCEKLVDIEERFQLWRFRHMTTVKRIIGFAHGTGGSSGVGFLKQALDLTFFPELWEVRTLIAAPPRRLRGGEPVDTDRMCATISAMVQGTMSRQAKGRVAPPPRLEASAQVVADAVAALPGVVVQAHWEIGSQSEVNGTDFYVGEEELGHIHLDGEAHVPVGAALAAVLVEARVARRFRWSRAFVVVDTTEPEAALRVFRIRHAQIGGATDAELRAQLPR